MKNNFFQVAAGASLLLLSAGFFVRSFDQAYAAPSPEHFLQNGTNTTGKFQMCLSTFVTNDGTTNSRVLVWDTQTGTSTYYKNEGNGFEKSSSQLPAKP